MRKWSVTIRGSDTDKEKYDLITLIKLRSTIRKLKSNKPQVAGNRWASPIVPLLLEHVFSEHSSSLDNISSFTINIRENKDITAC